MQTRRLQSPFEAGHGGEQGRAPRPNWHNQSGYSNLHTPDELHIVIARREPK